MIEHKRLQEQMNEVSKFGALAGGGITRLAFSPEEKAARVYVKSLMQDIGMHIREDAIGNIYGRLDGELPLSAVATGSHIDSVPLGGCYDGTLGVMCSLEAIRSIKESGISHKRPLELIIFSCEESSRFNMATVGSKVIAGKLKTEKIKALRDKNGVSLYDAAKDFGCDVEKLDKAELKKDEFYAYIELHIEQGPVLEATNTPVGIVSGIASPFRYELDIKGRADHSGATPMNMRQDALVCASEIILGIEKIASQKAGKSTVATVGFANAVPGVLNVIPGEVKLGIDIRDIDKESLEHADKLINELICEVVQKRGLSFTLKELARDFPTVLSKEIAEILANQAKILGVKAITLPSGAGHDAMHMPHLAQYTGMIFVPCKDGISHNVNEKVNMDDVYKAAEVLTRTLIELSNKE